VDFYPLNTNHGYRSGIHNLPLPITEMCLHVCVWGIIFEESRQVRIQYKILKIGC
jgi:hypothetical protein